MVGDLQGGESFGAERIRGGAAGPGDGGARSGGGRGRRGAVAGMASGGCGSEGGGRA